LIVAVVMLDDSTVEHGTLEVLIGSHRAMEFPSEDFIKDNRQFVCAPRGSAILIDGDLWHRVGHNKTKDFHLVVTCVFSRPYFKQGMDYPRFLSAEYASQLSPRMRQLFGFNARTPSSYEEWYQPMDKRFYQADQE
jgi:ectoine hydroxylase-related dioxygenase (phytanoyl-CoA dioxygenase family)